MIINNNMMAMNSHRAMGINQNGMGRSVEKLSTGQRINRAADDAAGLAISEKMRSQIRGLNQASRNAQDGISLIQTAEGAMNEAEAILQRMRELAVQSSNDTNTNDDRAELEKEVTQLKSEFDRIAKNTEFNTMKLLDGSQSTKLNEDTSASTLLKEVAFDGISFTGLKAGTYTLRKGEANGQKIYTIEGSEAAAGITLTSGPVTATTAQTIQFGGANGESVSIKTNNALAADAWEGKAFKITGNGALSFHIGSNTNQKMDIEIKDLRMTGGTTASITNVNAISISSKDGANNAITTIDAAIKEVSGARASLGAIQNRLEHTVKNLNVSAENLQSSESRIRDVDMAKQMSSFTKDNILSQASQAMLAQANQLPQQILQLLR